MHSQHIVTPKGRTQPYIKCLLVIIVIWLFSSFCLLVPGIWHADADGKQATHHKSWGIHLCHTHHIPGHCLHLLFLSPVVWYSWTAVKVLFNPKLLCLSWVSFVPLVWAILSSPAWYGYSVHAVWFPLLNFYHMSCVYPIADRIYITYVHW